MMTTISHTAATATVQAAPKAKARNAALDRARTFLTLVVLFHHSVIPYTYFGHTDPKFWIGFDAVVLATDSFFMAMFFFLSGLFVWPGLVRKGPFSYLRDRLLRLGLPFVICALTVIPIAYYAIELRQTPDVSFADFWWKTVTVGPWPSGPLWFLWVLFAFDLVASLLCWLRPNLLDPINRLSLRAFERPAEFFAVMLAVTAILYMRQQHLPILATCDVFSPGIALGQSIGRIGCFSAGCCWGTATHVPWAEIGRAHV